MTLEPLLLGELFALGLAIGFLAGLLGIGGGMLMVPFITLVVVRRGAPPALAVKVAIATSMATIVFTSLASLHAHHRRGSVRWDLVRTLAPGIVVGGLLASAGVFGLLKGAWLAALFGVFIAFSATRLLRPMRAVASARPMPGAGMRFLAGGGIGFLSGLVGAGGAFISVPILSGWNVPMHSVIATSAALGFPIAVSGTLGYVVAGWSLPPLLPGAFGYLYLPALAAIAAASVLAAPLGARAAHALDTRVLRRLFALLLYALAAYMLRQAIEG